MKSVNTDVAYDYIKNKIINGEYAPGHALMTESLASEIGVSRTPVRDAFRKLEADGLVTIRAHLGANVTKLNLKEYQEMCELRLAIESHAAGLAALHRTEADLRETQFALETMRRLTERVIAEPQNPLLLTELMREDANFHITILTAAKNDLLKKEILRLHQNHRIMAGPFRILNQPEVPGSAMRRHLVMAHHSEIYAAIANSDKFAAKKAMETHLQEMIDYNLLLITRAENGINAQAYR